jgi:indole-3-glycerol phosphate synthase
VTAVTGILARILARKREEVAALVAARLIAELARDAAAAATAMPVRSLAAALARPAGAPGVGVGTAPGVGVGNADVRVLAEIKRASPSAGPIRPGADPAEIARDYAAHGAAALSVLTDREFFDGDLAFLARVRAAVALPLLRKDFMIAESQVIEARAAGADAILVIAAAVPYAGGPDIAELCAAARHWGMDALVEVHAEAELDRALAAGATLIGVNHRDLATFAIDMGLTARLAPRLPVGAVLVAESGIKTRADVDALGAAGAHAVLVGESLMRAPSPGSALAALRGSGHG